MLFRLTFSLDLLVEYDFRLHWQSNINRLRFKLTELGRSVACTKLHKHRKSLRYLTMTYRYRQTSIPDLGGLLAKRYGYGHGLHLTFEAYISFLYRHNISFKCQMKPVSIPIFFSRVAPLTRWWVWGVIELAIHNYRNECR